MSRLMSALVATAALLLTGVGLAAPAQAAVTSVSCTGANPMAVLTGNSQTFNTTGGGDCRFVAADLGSGISASDVTVTISPSTTVTPGTPGSDVALNPGDVVNFAYSGSASGSVGLRFQDNSSNSFTYSVRVASGGGSSSSSSASSGPAPVVQQFGQPTTGTCDEAQPEGLDLSGVSSGGWGISWAQWMNGGNGGAVCTRTLVYSSAQGSWTVN